MAVLGVGLQRQHGVHAPPVVHFLVEVAAPRDVAADGAVVADVAQDLGHTALTDVCGVFVGG